MFILSCFSQLFFLATGVVGIGLLITIHEFGHFLFCKLFNVSVPSFSIGFGPALWQRKIGETTFSVAAIPLGGFVEIAGSAEIGQGEQKEAHRDDERSLVRKPYWQKLCIMLGGISLNFLFAYTVVIGIMLFGAPSTPLLPETISDTIEAVEPDSAAAKAGLQAGDRIISLNNVPLELTNIRPFFEAVAKAPGTTTIIVIERNQQRLEKQISFEATGCRILGVDFVNPLKKLSFTQAIKKGITTTNKFILDLFTFLKKLFTQRKLGEAGGPVGIIGAIMNGAQKGLKIYLLILAVISINLAVLNLIPLPILDGGQVVFYTIEAIIRRQIPHKVKEVIAIGCWVLFLVLTVYLTYYDIKRIVLSFLGK